jgi:molybdopterin converting factor small subunit
MKEAPSVVVIRVKLFGFLAQLDTPANFEIELETGSTVADLLHLLAERLGQDFRQALLDRHGNLHGGIEIILNQQHISGRKTVDIIISKDGELAIFPLVGGG